MKSCSKLIRLLPLLMLGLAGPGFGEVVIFDGVLQAGTLWSEGAGKSISSDLLYNGHDTLKYDFTGSWQHAGIWNPNLTVTSDGTILRIPFYADTNTAISSFKVDMSTTGSTFVFSNSNGSWTVDGAAGNTSFLTSLTPEWKIVELDLTSIPDTEIGTSVLNARIGVQRDNSGSGTVYFGEILLVPEPGTAMLMLAGLGALLLFRRR